MLTELKAIITDWECTCGGCPTIIEGTDSLSSRKVYYRLRHGYWRVAYDDDCTIIASASAPIGIDGVATTEEIRLMLGEHGIILV